MPVRRACDICYRKKIQCVISQAGSPCDWCSHHDIACTFDRVTLKKDGSQYPHEEVAGLKRRIEQLEATLAQSHTPTSTTWPSKRKSVQATSSLTDQSPILESPSPFLPLSHTPVARSDLSSPEIATQSEPTRPRSLLRQAFGRSWLFKDMQLLCKKSQKWMSLRTGQDNVLERFCLFDNDEVAMPLAKRRLRTTSCKDPTFPEQSLTKELLTTYKQSASSFDCLMPDEELWEVLLEQAYSNSPPAASVACVWALHAYMSAHKPAEKEFRVLDGCHCAIMAQALIGETLGQPSMEGLQAILLLVEYFNLTSDRSKFESLHALGCRIVSELDGHRSPALESRADINRLVSIRLEHARKLFYAFYVLDSDISLRTGKPPLLPEEYCDLSSSKVNHQEDPDTYVLPHDTRLCTIKERISRLLHSPKMYSTSDAQILEGIRSLDSELEEWRLSLPPETRPKISIHRHHPSFSAAEHRQKRHAVHLQFDYHYVLVVLHNIVRRCGPEEGRELPEDLHTVIHSSIDVSLEAARSTLRFLPIASDPDTRKVYRRIISYLPIAIMSIFINVLLHPRDTRGPADLEILGGTVSHLQGLPLDEVSLEEIATIEELCELIMELVRLAHRAIWRAKRGDGQ